MKKAAADKKKTVKEGSEHKLTAARLEGKSHGLRGHAYCANNYEDMAEARAYHEGYKEGLDECFDQTPLQGYVGEEGGLPATVPGMADAEMDEAVNLYSPRNDGRDHLAHPDSPFALAQRAKDATDEGNAFTAGLARTPRGSSFSLGGRSFTDRTDYDAAFESWDKQLDTLLNEGINVSISKGQQGGSDSVSINATDSDADQLLALVKQAGLGIFGGEESATDASPVGFGADGEAGPAAEIEVVDDQDDMLSLIKKLTGMQGEESGESSEDYADEEGEESEVCADCGSEECECGSGEEDSEEGEEESDEGEESEEEEQVDEVESVDQMTYQVAENDEEEEQVTEWANDAGQSKDEFDDETFKTDIDFITKLISGGANKEKQTGQTTEPVIAGQKPRMGSDGVNEGKIDTLSDWRKLSGIK